MPVYEYECGSCGAHFERKQSMSDSPLQVCPECGGEVRRKISGGTGFMFKGSGSGSIPHRRNSCSMEQSGRTCCGRDERCGKPPCGSGS